ncbi:hypothetical protein PPROV_000187900 [Pycnococcus provasolii]|uniref:polynucleotide adenylyltransferase n=1 Tax=Pycnococcus provasolii TaxID=41880 RepID=A0A830H7T2_9CHLO|nr:hypothetical protein PPROV_000187900 [Pycnococcus provasolii]
MAPPPNYNNGNGGNPVVLSYASVLVVSPSAGGKAGGGSSSRVPGRNLVTEGAGGAKRSEIKDFTLMRGEGADAGGTQARALFGSWIEAASSSKAQQQLGKRKSPSSAAALDPLAPSYLPLERVRDDDEHNAAMFIPMPVLEDDSEKEEEEAPPPLPAAATGEDGYLADMLDNASTPPWLARGGVAELARIKSASLQLHHEVCRFVAYAAPSKAEVALRQAAVERIRDAVTAIWPHATLEVFGSFATGLYLPTSDVDAVVMGSKVHDIPSGLKALAAMLMRRQMATNIQVIAKARVPIIKYVDSTSQIPFDVSFDVANGPEAAVYVREQMATYPPLKPLIYVLKLFLQQRELNEVYNGGVGSYALLSMVLGFLKTHPSRYRPASHGKGGSRAKTSYKEMETNLGILLVDFLCLYGRRLSYVDAGVSCRDGGHFFSKSKRGDAWLQPSRPGCLCVEDPRDADNDLGRNSYNISHVRNAFGLAFDVLTSPTTYPGESRLAKLVRPEANLYHRLVDGEKQPASGGGGGGGGARAPQPLAPEIADAIGAVEAVARKRKRSSNNKEM